MSISKRAWRAMQPGKYWPHQGKKECARRRRQFNLPGIPKTDDELPEIAVGAAEAKADA